MSYSFQIKAANKAEAKAAVEAEFDKVLEHQPEHARDKAAALAKANAAIDLLGEDNTQDVVVSCNGYISWRVEDNAPGPLTGVSVNVQAYQIAREIVLTEADAKADLAGTPRPDHPGE